MKIYVYYTNHHRKKHMRAINQERETRYGEIVREMTWRGKSAREIANFIQCPENWVARYRTRHSVPMPPGTAGRPRNGDDTPRRERHRAARRAAAAAERATERAARAVPVARVRGSRAWFPIPPLHEARPASPNRRKTFDYEDTEEL